MTDEKRKKITLLKSQTGLPANIIDIQKYFTAEFGPMQYAEVQNNSNDEVEEDNYFWIMFRMNCVSSEELRLKKMIAFPNAYHKFNRIIKDSANLIIYADRNKEPGRNEYFVREVYLNEE